MFQNIPIKKEGRVALTKPICSTDKIACQTWISCTVFWGIYAD